MLDFIANLLLFFQHHPYWAAAIAFCIAFIESIAILGIFIPGSTILGLIGGLIGAHLLLPTAIIIASITGAIAGDGLSYWLGYHYHSPIRSSWPLNRFSPLLAKGEKFFIRYGGVSIFLGRFFGPLRGIMPLIAGLMRLEPKRFFIANILSACIWAPGYILIGILIGHQIEIAIPHHTVKIFTQIIVVILLFWVLYYVTRSKLIKLRFLINHRLKQHHGQIKSAFWKHLLRDLHMPSDHRQLITLILGSVMLFLFLLLTTLLLLHIEFKALNHTLYHSLQHLSNPYFVTVMKGVSLLGDTTILFPLAGLIFIYLFLKKKRRLAWHWLALILITRFSLSFFKELVHFPRHEIGSLTHTTHFIYSFPSGHVGMAFAFWGFLSFIIRQEITEPRLKKDILGLAIFIILIVALSRLFLGMHWLTDVIGSILIGFAYLNFAILSYRRGKHTS